jgi:O-antigen/teichoic acid export membrane protein
MLVVLLKFAEVGTRAIFVVGTSYLLPLDQAGQFGLIVTLQGLASFAFGYERHTDIQRRVVGAEPWAFDRAVGQALRLFAANYLVVSPIYAALLLILMGLSPWLICLAIVVAVAEQLMNQAYLMAMVNPRYRPLMGLAVMKNTAILAVLAWLMLADPARLGLGAVLVTWAAASVGTVGVAALIWIRLRHPHPDPGPGLRESLNAQYRASWHHFLLGLVAILALQIDRLVIGAVMPLDQVGVYFRHILMVSMIYQVFNIAFLNRVLPAVFALAKRAPLSDLRAIARREYLRVLVFVGSLALAGLVLHLVTGDALADRFSLVPAYFAGLLVMSCVRMRADFNGLILNALHQEAAIFRLQLISFTLNFPVLVGLTWALGIPGTIASGITGAALYLAFTRRTLIRQDRESPALAT